MSEEEIDALCWKLGWAAIIFGILILGIDWLVLH